MSTTLSVVNPITAFLDIDGQPLDGGYIYVGVAGLNAETNPIQVYWDKATNIPAAQPLRTKNGFIVRAGAYANVYARVDHSMIVKNRNATIVSSELNAWPSFGTISEHSELNARDAADSHPTKAITGLDFFEDFRQAGWTDTQTAQAAAASGRHVTVNGGSYTLTAQIVFASGTVFAGRKGASFTTSAIDRPFLFSGVTDSGITGCRMVCSRVNNSTYSHGAISVESASSRLIFKNNKIEATNIHGISIIGGAATANSDIEFSENRSSQAANIGYAFHVWMAGREFANNSGAINEAGNEDIRFSKNKFIGGDNGFIIDGDGVEVLSNSISGIYAPIACTFVRDLRISSNRISQFVGNGITIGNGSNDIIEGFVVSDNILRSSVNILHGINVYKQGGDSNPVGSPNLGLDKRGVISGNSVYGVSGNGGIFAYGNGSISITGNNVHGFGNGIMAATAATGVHPGKLSITGNEVDGAEIGIALGSSAQAAWKNVVVSGNQLNVSVNGISLSRLTNFTISGNQINGVGAYNGSTYQGVGVSINICSKGTITGNDIDGETGFSDFWWQLTANPDIVISGNRGDGDYYRLGANDPIFHGNMRSNGSVIDAAGGCEYNAGATATATYKAGQTASNHRAGSFLVYYSGSRDGSSDFATYHSECLALVRATRVAGPGGAWTFTVAYLNQVNGATVSASASSDVISFVGASNIPAVTSSLVSVQPLQSLLINNGQAI